MRSSPDLLGFDLQHNLGFLSNPKHFNVSISRAQALLIVVGNPDLLSKVGKGINIDTPSSPLVVTYSMSFRINTGVSWLSML